MSVADGRDDRALARAARDGDERAFDALFYRYRDTFFRIGLALGVDDVTAEELVLRTFARAHRAFERGTLYDEPRLWLHRLAFGASREHAERHLLALRHLCGLRATEIAAVIGEPVATVRVKLHAALEASADGACELALAEQLDLEDRIADALAPLRRRMTGMSVARVRAAVRWGLGDGEGLVVWRAASAMPSEQSLPV